MARISTITIEGMTLKELAKRSGIEEMTLRARYRACIQRGETPNIELLARDSLIAGGGLTVEGVSLRHLARLYGIPYGTLYWRYRHGCQTISALIARGRRPLDQMED